MRKVRHLLLSGVLLSFVSCGSLSINPQGCRTGGEWTDGMEDGKPAIETSFSEEYFVWNDDLNIKLLDFLKERKIECSEVKKIRMNLESVFFVKRKLTIFIQ
ncbi:MAG: hypothetical protein EHM20_05605 [Alphaproteobacteria bacterium]|nr:MAG: hypothetical protein EHM20_05605 [Alphaproteobacteria bacterium]